MAKIVGQKVKKSRVTSVYEERLKAIGHWICRGHYKKADAVLEKCLNSPTLSIAFEAAKFIYEQRIGKAQQAVNLGGEVKVIDWISLIKPANDEQKVKK